MIGDEYIGLDGAHDGIIGEHVGRSLDLGATLDDYIAALVRHGIAPGQVWSRYYYMSIMNQVDKWLFLHGLCACNKHGLAQLEPIDFDTAAQWPLKCPIARANRDHWRWADPDRLIQYVQGARQHELIVVHQKTDTYPTRTGWQYIY